MGRQKLPIELLQARGAKHLTKAEIKERQATELKPITDNIIAPEYLTKKQVSRFYVLSEQLEKLKIMGETDVDALARYILAEEDYIYATKQLRKADVRVDVDLYGKWVKIQDTHFKQCKAIASELGLTIAGRCKLVIPEPKVEAPKDNKFKKFEKRSG